MTFQILALSGGGFRGLFTSSVLTRLEEQAKRPLHECFDLISGTSAGGIIALGLAMGKKAETIQEMFLEHGEEIFPRGETPNRGGAPQLLAVTRDGGRTVLGLFESGQVVMLDTSLPEHPRPLSVVNLGLNAGTHSVELSPDERRLVVSDYFLSEDMFGKVHLEGDHKVRVLNVSRISMVLDPRFELDFNTAFPTGPARPHGMAIK